MNRKFKIVAFQLGLLLVMLAIIEVVLRFAGYQPGDMKPKWLNFKPVDSLYVIHDFFIDKDGILVADSAYWTDIHIPVNEDGFRTPSFSKIDATKKKILFIGDSFTWGMSAKPMIDNCFVDLVRNKTGYEVVNLGIPAADPAQYSAIAQKYIPLLKPDFVFVMFFMGNDLMITDREVSATKPFCYYTNAGAVMADMDGKHFETAAEAYNYFVNEKYYLKHPANVFEWVISKSALLSRLYSYRFRLQEKIAFERTAKHSDITKKYLRNILQAAKQNGAQCRFVLIPEVKEADMKIEDYRKKYTDLLNDPVLANNWVSFQSDKKYYLDYPDAHLNNAGHRLYADSLEAILKSSFASK